MADQVFTVRVRVLPPHSKAELQAAPARSFFDIPHIEADTDFEALRFAMALSHQYFGLPLDLLYPLVLSKKPIIDC